MSPTGPDPHRPSDPAAENGPLPAEPPDSSPFVRHRALLLAALAYFALTASDLSPVAANMFWFLNKSELMAIPFFILAADILGKSRAARRTPLRPTASLTMWVISNNPFCWGVLICIISCILILLRNSGFLV